MPPSPLLSLLHPFLSSTTTMPSSLSLLRRRPSFASLLPPTAAPPLLPPSTKLQRRHPPPRPTDRTSDRVCCYVADKPPSRYRHIVCQDISNRRHLLASGGVSLVSVSLLPLVAWAGDEQEEKDESLVGAIKKLFDPNEKTKSGKLLPKAYLKSAREVVKTLRESLMEDPNDMAKFRRTADAAKESIREYLATWKGQQTVINEESYIVIEKAIRSLASFYSKAGPSAPLPEEVKSDIINNLNTADNFL